MRVIAASMFVLVASCQPFVAPAPSGQGGPNAPPSSGGGPPGMAGAAPASAPAPASDPWNGGSESTATAPENPYGDAPPAAEPARRRPPPPPPQQPAPGGDDSLPPQAKAMVAEHNAARAKHCVPPLTWSPKLAQVAQSWANSLRDHQCAFEHSRGSYGENLAAGTTGYMDPKAVVAMWYGEIKDYRYDQPGFSMQTGHFTQVVWKSTTQVGCGMSQCNGMDVWVCEYDPAGNWEGQFKDNVPQACK